MDSGVVYPGESQDYREARNALLAAEIDLKRAVEKVAAQRRALPLGGKVPQNYVFEEVSSGRKVNMSDLFKLPGKSLIVYSLMFGPESEQPCGSCVMFMDSLNGMVPHLTQKINLAVIVKAPVQKAREWVQNRQWKHLPVYSSYRNTFNKDYHAEKDGANGGFQQGQLPACNVFRKVSDSNTNIDSIVHTWGTEMMYTPPDEGQQWRHLDLLGGIWPWFDLTPEGRPDFHPQPTYD